MQRVTRALVLVSLAIAGGWRSGAGANDLCGLTVTDDLRLEHDLVCAGDGLIVGADGIKVDLNGHSVTGSGAGTGVIVVGRTGVTITGGMVRNFAVGIRLNTATGVVIRHNEFAGSGEHVDMQAGSIGNTIKENVFRDATTRAIMLRGNVRDNEIKGNTFTGNRLGILVFAGADNQIKDNVISGSSLAGMRMNVFATGNVIKGNTIAASAAGVEFLVTPTGSAIGNELKENSLTGNACAVKGPITGNALKDNRFESNAADSCS